MAPVYLFFWELGGFGLFTSGWGAGTWRKRRLRQGATSVMSFKLSSSGLAAGASGKEKRFSDSQKLLSISY